MFVLPANLIVAPMSTRFGLAEFIDVLILIVTELAIRGGDVIFHLEQPLPSGALTLPAAAENVISMGTAIPS